MYLPFIKQQCLNLEPNQQPKLSPVLVPSQQLEPKASLWYPKTYLLKKRKQRCL